jgi:hypothetical protein
VEEVEGDGAEGCLKWIWCDLRGDSLGAGPIGFEGMKSFDRARTLVDVVVVLAS